MAHRPGSFSKNFGWHSVESASSTDPVGLRKLHAAIRAGFLGKLLPVERDVWRSNCGIEEHDLQLIPLNFFLHNSIIDGKNFVSVDELVIHAITHYHSSQFDKLALFALNLSRGGFRHGTNFGEAKPALWANDFVKDVLWLEGGWRGDAFDKEIMDRFLSVNLDAEPDVCRKVRTNYRYIYDLCGFLKPSIGIINTQSWSWAIQAHFLTWDRLRFDSELTPPLSIEGLITSAIANQLYKLVGATETEEASLAEEAAQLYLDFEPSDRLAAPSAIQIAIEQTQSDASVSRRLRSIYQQIRNPRSAKHLKDLYSNRCTFCGDALQVSTDPNKFFSNAAHIKPLGEPHNGP